MYFGVCDIQYYAFVKSLKIGCRWNYVYACERVLTWMCYIMYTCWEIVKCQGVVGSSNENRGVFFWVSTKKSGLRLELR